MRVCEEGEKMSKRSKSRSRSPVDRRTSGGDRTRSPIGRQRVQTYESRRNDRRRSRSPDRVNRENESRRPRWSRDDQPSSRRHESDNRRRMSWRDRNDHKQVDRIGRQEERISGQEDLIGGRQEERIGRQEDKIGGQEEKQETVQENEQVERWQRSDDHRFRRRSFGGRQRDTGRYPDQDKEIGRDESGRGRRDSGGRGRIERGGFRGRRNSHSMEETIKQVIVNPMEVPKSNKYFTHDDREMSRRGRREMGYNQRPGMLTPMKWGHDMFDKMVSDDSKEETPPLEEKNAISSVVNVVDTLDLSQEVFQELDLFPSEAEV